MGKVEPLIRVGEVEAVLFSTQVCRNKILLNLGLRDK